MWDPSQGCKDRHSKGTGSIQAHGRQQNAPKSKDVTQSCTLWALLQTHAEDDAGIFQENVGCRDGMSDTIPVPNPLGACLPPQRGCGSSWQSPSRALQHRDQLLYITFKSLNTAFTWQIPEFIYTQHSSRSVTPFPTPQGGGSYNPAAEDKLGGPSKPRCSRWVCEWSCLQQARHPWALNRAVFQSDSWSFMFDSPSGPASKHSLKPFHPASPRSISSIPTTWWVHLKCWTEKLPQEQV